MVRPWQLEMMKNHLEKSGAVPKWEEGDAGEVQNWCIFIEEIIVHQRVR